eukprot:gnl/Carplike_NY0171/8823_a12266_164.p1 GENE.gnl/Carplike_NY0171/8823_a12266_164~~gnl/Carplike_NY0171/8823_a12266_164.p1  ORF type:complete len:113 (-),score=17.78 gnl/Carplike_NY0171/8823_a12266_164:103-441(-)
MSFHSTGIYNDVFLIIGHLRIRHFIPLHIEYGFAVAMGDEKVIFDFIKRSEGFKTSKEMFSSLKKNAIKRMKKDKSLEKFERESIEEFVDWKKREVFESIYLDMVKDLIPSK